METDKILELEGKMEKMRLEIEELSGSSYKNNFTSSQVFNKDCVFNTRLRVPIYSSAPTVAEVGDLIAVSGELFICTQASPAVFTLVGSQS